MTDDTARARAEFEANFAKNFRPTSDYHPTIEDEKETAWKWWLAAWTSRAPAQDERADAERAGYLRGIEDAASFIEMTETIKWSAIRRLRLSKSIRALIDADRSRKENEA